MGYFFQDLIGTQNLVTISYIATILIDTFVLILLVLWFFKRAVSFEKCGEEMAYVAIFIVAFIFNIGTLAQIIDYPEGYYPVAFFIQGFAVLAILAACVIALAVVGIFRLRDRIPERN